MAPERSGGTAPWLPLPQGDIISVEHPCYIKHSVETAINMIGGASAISQALAEDSDTTFALSFCPDDPTARTIMATKKDAQNVLLQVRVPKRTGRKRKRGTNDPWTEDLDAVAPKKDATYLLQSMSDNPNRYSINALSSISHMHIWRSMPDFQYSTSQIPILDEVKSKILSQHYPTIKDFDLPNTHGLQDTTTLPPAIWSSQSIPQNYTYRQNPSVKVVKDPSTGQRTLRNTQAAPKIYSYQMQWDDAEYPANPMPNLLPLAEQSETFQKTVAALATLFEERPIWTRRALLNKLESQLSSFNVVRFCLAYVAFAVRSGPWRDTYIRLGVDPRTDPKYRFYQTIMLQLVPKEHTVHTKPATAKLKKSTDQQPPDDGADAEEKPASPAPNDRDKVQESRQTYARFWSRSNNPTSHIFDGVSPLPPDGKIWQLCDITDPQIATLRDVPDLHVRPACETRYFGWYYNGTNAKMRVCLKAKTEALQNGRVLDPEVLEGFLKLPERVSFGPVEQLPEEQSIPSHQNGRASAQSSTAADTASAPVAQPPEIPLRNDTLPAYLGSNASRQQLEWAALYRAFARTEPGQKPVSGGAGHGRLTKSKPEFRKSYRVKNPEANVEGSATAPRPGGDPQVDRGGQQDPIDVDDDASSVVEAYEEGPDLAEGEDVLPSVEVNDFDVDEGDDSELGLDVDLEIKLEEGDNEWGGHHVFQGPIHGGLHEIQQSGNDDNVDQAGD